MDWGTWGRLLIQLPVLIMLCGAGVAAAIAIVKETMK